ncbi:MAG: YkgJ family cysteine cluster protein [Promethearchaeota archaeon]
MKKTHNQLFWTIIRTFNTLMKESIDGPDCTNPDLCKGDCCSIKIDVPKVLAEEYINKSLATENDFIRSNIFSFHLRFDEQTGKCFFFDKQINGCKIHNSGIKPPQCWIYPAGFSNPENKDINCKKLPGWKITNAEKTLKAEKLLKKYIFLCQLEAKKEFRGILQRLGIKDGKKSLILLENLKNNIKAAPPSSIGGFKDGWDHLEILSAEGLSFQMKKICLRVNAECKYLPHDYFECNNTCDVVALEIIQFLQKNLLKFVKSQGLEVDGKYPLYQMLGSS